MNFTLSKYLLFTCILFACAKAIATTSEQMTLPELIEKSSACVVASVMGVKYAEEEGSLYTYTKFKVKKVAFGSPNKIITVKTLGGEKKLGRLAVSEIIPGAPRFFGGQDNMLFLSESNKKDEYTLTTLSQGAMNIQNGPQGSTVVLSNMGAIGIEQALETIGEQRAPEPSTPSLSSN